jgi:hypothetical protein
MGGSRKPRFPAAVTNLRWIDNSVTVDQVDIVRGLTPAKIRTGAVRPLWRVLATVPKAYGEGPSCLIRRPRWAPAIPHGGVGERGISIQHA